jgi:hypothetical protein
LRFFNNHDSASLVLVKCITATISLWPWETRALRHHGTSQKLYCSGQVRSQGRSITKLGTDKSSTRSWILCLAWRHALTSSKINNGMGVPWGQATHTWRHVVPRKGLSSSPAFFAAPLLACGKLWEQLRESHRKPRFFAFFRSCLPPNSRIR